MSASVLSSRLRWPVILDYGIACATPALAFALDVMFNRLWGIDPSASLFLCGIMLVAWTSGPGPALLATGLTILAFDYLLMQPGSIRSPSNSGNCHDSRCSPSRRCLWCR
jgi:K+-sensing histidine kinase KdpD